MKYISSIFISIIIVSCQANSWTRTYQFTADDFSYQGGTLSAKADASLFFTQLLVSWNAKLPAQGYYSFHLRVFDQTTQKWLSYPIYEWGKNKKKSFQRKKSHGNYNYVRFEGKKGHRYKKFEIVVQARGGADIQQVHALSVCASNMAHFKPESLKSIKSMRANIYIPDVPCYCQYHDDYPESSGWCSPTSVAQLIAYYTNKHVSVPTFARQVYDEGLGVFGSWPFNMIAVSLHLPDFDCYVTRLESFKKLINQLSLGFPVIVSIRCNTPLKGAPKAYPAGHLITVVGVDVHKQVVICNDTAVRDNDCVKYYPLEPFVRAWENSFRLAYIIMPS